MSRSDFETVAADIAGNSLTKFGASLVEVSPIWKSLQSNPLAAFIGQPGLDHLVEQNAKIASFAAPVQNLAALVANPVFDEMTSSVQRLSEEVVRPVLANLKLPELRLANVEMHGLADLKRVRSQLFEIQRLAEMAAFRELRFDLPEVTASQRASTLRGVPDLDCDDGDLEVDAIDLDVPHHTPLLAVDDRFLLLRAFWVFFVVAQLATPEGRRLLDEYSAVWELITALVFLYGPRE